MTERRYSAAKVRLAANFSFLRSRAGKSQREIAEVSGVSQKTISSMEDPGAKNSPVVTNVEKLAECYRVPLGALFEEDLSQQGSDIDGLMLWMRCYAGLTGAQQRMLLNLARELTINT